MRPEELNPREHYIETLYADEDSGLKAIRDRLVDAGRWGVNIGAAEGRLLQVLIGMIGAKKGVEIGTLFGYSAVWIARALPSDGHLYTIERDHDSVRMARKAFEECGVLDRVSIHEGEASDKLAELSDRGPFDFVFIDANKSAYLEYLEWASAHVRRGGLIIADNTLLGGGVVESEKPDSLSMRQWSGMRQFNEAIANRSKYASIIVPTREGLTVAVKL
jgi:predicted O-methyltransferase YrrM